MTDQTPIERAALNLTLSLLAGKRVLSPAQATEAARAAFQSIDTDQLARVIHAWDVEGGLCDGPFDDLTDTQKDVWHSAALAVKNWLTGKEPQ